MIPPFRPLRTAREGDRISSETINRLEQEVYASRQLTADHPLQAHVTPNGNHVSLERVTLDPIRFKLSEPLYHGQSATAQQLFFSHTAGTWSIEGGEVTVWDSTGLGGSTAGDTTLIAPALTKGMARYLPDSGVFEVVSIGNTIRVQYGTITARGYRNGNWVYAFTPETPVLRGEYEDDTEADIASDEGAWVSIATTQEATASVHQKNTVTVTGGTSGTYFLTVDGVDTQDLPYNAALSAIITAINDVLGSGTVAASSGAIEWQDYTDHTISADVTDLLPAPVDEAYHTNNDKVMVGHRCFFWPGNPPVPEHDIDQMTFAGTTYGGSFATGSFPTGSFPSGSFYTSGTVAESWEIWIKGAVGGTWTLTIDGTDIVLDWNETSTSLETAMSTAGFAWTASGSGTEADPFLITADDNDEHDVSANFNDLEGARDWRFGEIGAPSQPDGGITRVGGFQLSEIPVSTSPSYVLALDASGYLCKVAVEECE